MHNFAFAIAWRNSKMLLIMLGCFLLVSSETSQVSSLDSLLDFSELDFIHDEAMKFYGGIETTITILKPIRQNIVVPIWNTVKGVAGKAYSTGVNVFNWFVSSGGKKPTTPPVTTITYIKETKTYKRRKEPSDKFFEAVCTIERGVTEAKAARRWRRSAVLSDLATRNTILELAVEKRMFQYARQKLGHTLYDINHSGSGRSKRSTKSQASRIFKGLKNQMGSEMFDKFMAVKGDVTLAFAIDTTGSMADEIETAKNIAIDVINYPRQNPVNYILSPFNDPDTGPVVFKDSSEGALFVKTIGNLRAHGGGDCPEFTITGISDALYDSIEYGSPLYVFTDATAKDDYKDNIEEIKSFAKDMKITISFFTAGSNCGNPNYKPFQEIADATSGQVLPLANVQELMKFNSVIGNDVSGSSTVIKSGSNVPKRRKRRDVRDYVYSIKVDESIKKMSVCITTTQQDQGSTITLTNPRGVQITSGKKSMSRVSVYEVSNPLVGTWTLTIPSGCGTHTYYVKSTSDTNIAFKHDFMQPLPGPIANVPDSQPLIGRQTKVIITIPRYRKVQKNTVTLELITRYGEHIRQVRLTPDNRGMRYVVTITPPSQPFKLKIKGTTKAGNLFERISHNVIEPKHVMLRVLYSNKDFILQPGQRTFVTLYIFNAGADNTMKLAVKDRLGYAAPIRRSTRTVRKGRWAFARVVFNVPSGAKVNVSDIAMVSLSYNNGAGLVKSPVRLLVVA